MERNLEIMTKELECIKKERKPLYKAIDVLNDKIIKLIDEIEKYKLDNGLYYPMSELAKYKGKEISRITLVERKKDGTLDTEDMFNDEMFSIDENGHLNYSSYNNGVMGYDENIGKYVEYYHFNKTEHDYIGYLEVKFYDED